ncbi:alpha/beta hydrolase [Methylopila henanensis]|uniref:Alpha/beta hydrolase n=1 Tax=Methylopila henanensis TaxID=873516 RepID=A0ABW4KE34_9HYPH
MRRAALLLAAALTMGCAAQTPAVVVGTSAASASARSRTVSFETHRRDALDGMERRRAFQGSGPARELAWNAPMEWRPRGRPRAGVLLVHGLGDSPWTFRDIGAALAARGYLVRTVLLPGHGTRPEDLLDVTLEEWRRVVEAQTDALRSEVGLIVLGGFSTGANLIVEQAYRNDDVAGLLLFSPAFRSDSAYA